MEAFATVYSIVTFCYVLANYSRAIQVQTIDVRIERLKLHLQSCMDVNDQIGISERRAEIQIALAVKEKITGWGTIESIETKIRNQPG
jgi:hypothetical protein